MLRAMEIEVWADVVCPWCYIGKRKLENAIATFGKPVNVVYRAFQLDPTTPVNETRLTTEVIAQKYGRSPDEVKGMMDNVTHAAADVGLAYDLEKTRSGNTLLAHRLLKLAGQQGKGAEAWERLYRAYFTEAHSLFDIESLCTLANEIGVTGAKEALSGQLFADEVNADFKTAREIGVTGVPFFLVNHQLAMSGAQPSELLVRMLQQAEKNT